MNYPTIEHIEFEENDERLKITMPVERNWPLFGAYCFLLLLWVGATGWMLGLLFRQSLSSLPGFFLIVYLILLLIWIYIWWRLGRMVWRWWQYYAATRELFFVYKDMVIVRRPLSLLGVTDAYDRRHAEHYYFSDKHQAIAFNFGSRGVLFGGSLPRTSADQLIFWLNSRYFPHVFEEE